MSHYVRRDPLAGNWSATAKIAIEANPDYFVWWYTVKSVGLCVAVAYAAYLYGRSKGPA